jgi:hypothetical protein
MQRQREKGVDMAAAFLGYFCVSLTGAALKAPT